MAFDDRLKNYTLRSNIVSTGIIQTLIVYRGQKKSDIKLNAPLNGFPSQSTKTFLIINNLFCSIRFSPPLIKISCASSWMRSKEYYDRIMILIRNNTILTKNLINSFKTVFSHNSLPRWHCLGSLNSLYVPI